MEARVARLESDVAHLLSAVAEIKAGLLALRDRMDDRMDRLESKLESRLVWTLSLQLAFGAGILGAMARGFGWL